MKKILVVLLIVGSIVWFAKVMRGGEKDNHSIPPDPDCTICPVDLSQGKALYTQFNDQTKLYDWVVVCKYHHTWVCYSHPK